MNNGKGIEIPEEKIEYFLEDEVRNGFYIPAEIKQFWGAEIILLKEIDDLCREHDLHYFADCGTLLGTVRHGGFVPWDDDLDILMLREDYLKLLQLQENHPEVLPDGMEIRSFRNREDIKLFHGVVTGSGHISYDPGHLEQFCGCPYIVGIDIFVLDHKSISPERQAQMAKNALYTIAAGDSIEEGMIKDRRTIREILDRIRKFPGAKDVPTEPSLEPVKMRIALYEVAESLFASFMEEGSDKLIQNFPRGLKNPTMETEKSFYKKAAYLPFEFLKIPVSIQYNLLLTKKYHQYLNVIKDGGAHEYPCFSEQKRSLKANADFVLPEFHYDPEQEKEIKACRDQSRKEGYKATLSECLSMLKEQKDRILDSEDLEESLAALANAQKLAMDLGQFIESVKGEGTPLVAALEDFCEKVFGLYQNLTEGQASEEDYRCFNAAFVKAETEIDGMLSQKTCVFLPFRADGFRYCLREYEKKIKEGWEVFLVPIPYYHKKFDGTIIREIFHPEDYPENLKLTDYKTFDFTLYHPEEIVIQFPYDGENPVMTVAPGFYARRLAGLTECLTYIPWFQTSDFTVEDQKDYVNSTAYVNTPGVVYADRVFLPSEAIRLIYEKRLAEFMGIPGEQLTDRLVVDPETKPVWRKNNTLFYYIGLSAFAEHGERALIKLKDNLETFRKNKDSLTLHLYVDESVEYNLPDLFPELWQKLSSALDSLKEEDWIRWEQPGPQYDPSLYYDAYYGDTGRFVRSFVDAGKPVMIANPEV